MQCDLTLVSFHCKVSLVLFKMSSLEYMFDAGALLDLFLEILLISCCRNPAVLSLWVLSPHVLQQILDGMDVGEDLSTCCTPMCGTFEYYKDLFLMDEEPQSSIIETHCRPGAAHPRLQRESTGSPDLLQHQTEGTVLV